MLRMKSRANNKFLAELPAVLGYLGVAVAGMYVLDPSQRLPAGILLVIFGGAYFFDSFYKPAQWVFYLLTSLETILVAALMVISPGWGVFPILFCVMAPMVMTHFPRSMGVIWIGIFSLVTAVIDITSKGTLGMVMTLPYLAAYVFFAAFGWMLIQAQRDRRRSEQLLGELQQAHHQLRDYADRVEELAIAEERNRIAREMHDTLGHRLTVAAVQLEGAQRLVRASPERAEKMIATVREQVRDGLGELRQTVAMLRAPLEEDIPLSQALEKLTHQVEEAAGIQVQLAIEDAVPPLAAIQRQAVYRAAQEGLTNIQRHARATQAWLRLSCEQDQVTLLVSDNGSGIAADEPRAGFGLTGLRERASLLGGEFTIDPRPGGGTQLTFRIPLVEHQNGLEKTDDARTSDPCLPG